LSVKLKLIAAVVVLFIGFWLFTDPRGLADFAAEGGGMVWSITEEMFLATMTFLREIFR
jgi:hypothetical protein